MEILSSMSSKEISQSFVVSKFGGTSVGTAAAMKLCGEVLRKRPETKVVVLSATAKTTNQLVMLIQKSIEDKSECDEDLEKMLHVLEKRHNEIIEQLLMENLKTKSLWEQNFFPLYQNLMTRLKELLRGIRSLKSCPAYQKDEILATGELLSSLIFSAYLQSVFSRPVLFCDVRDVLRTDDHFGQACVDLSFLRQQCLIQWMPLWEKKPDLLLVTQGFIGRTEKGETTTLGRGGSDYSAALLAEACSATHLEIWTDVPGVLTIDPKIGPGKIIPELTYYEAAELANLGAKVLHPLTLIPTLRQKIPVYVGNTFSQETQGTWIRDEMEENIQERPLIRAMAYREKQGILTLSKIKTPETHGFLAHVFRILAEHRLSVDLVTTSEISTALTFHDSPAFQEDVLKELSALADTTWETGLSLISVIGPDLVGPAGVAAALFQTIQDIPLRYICMGSGKNNISFLVKEEHAKHVLLRLHQRFFSS